MSFWYFAYGSNMASATLRDRRGITYERAIPSRAVGWQLVVDKPPLVPIGESFANIIPHDGSEVMGVAFKIAAADLDHIDLSEGVLIGNYERITIVVEPLQPNGSAPLQAFTLTSDRRDPSLHPSQRYMDLLITGALEHELPAAYVAFLRTIPVVPEATAAIEFRSLVDQVLHRRS